MENTPVFARQNSAANLDAKLHQGYDPSIEHREQGTLFSNVQYSDEYQKEVPKTGDAEDKDTHSPKNGIGDSNTPAHDHSALIAEGNAAHIGYAPENNQANGLQDDNADFGLDAGSFGGDGFTVPVGDSARSSVVQQDSPVPGGDGSQPTPSNVGGSADPTPPTPDNPPGGPVLSAPQITTQPVDGDENQAVFLNISVVPDNDPGVMTTVMIFGIPAGGILSAGIDNHDGSWTLTLAQLGGLTLTPPLNFSGGLGLSVQAVSMLNGMSASASQGLSVTVEGVANAPTLSVQPASGDENAAIPLTINAGLTDTDGSETLSITIGNVPNGAILSAGINNHNGTWTLTPTQLIGLTITPPFDSADPITLHVTATSSENGTTASISHDLGVTIGAIASTPFLTVQPASGDESTPIPLIISAALSDTDGSETLSIMIAGVPNGAALSAGIDNHDGTWTLTVAQLAGLTITPVIGSDTDFVLHVTATSSENGTTASVSHDLPVDVEGVATPPNLSVQPADGDEGTPISLSIAASLVDNDGSETLSITIAGVPTGAILSAGIDNHNGTWTLTPAQLAGLTITPPAGSDNDFTLNVTATSSENGTTASVTDTIPVTVDGVANGPILSVTATASGAEDTSIPLVISAALTDNDGSEVLSLTISGVPAGAVLSHGSSDGNGVWTLSVTDLAGLTITPPANFSGVMNLEVTAISTEQSDGSDAQTGAPCTVTVTPVVDLPDLTVHAANGFEDQAINLDIQSALVDTDGSEILSIRISGMPAGASLSAGIDNHDGSWTLTAAQLSGLQIMTAANKADDFDLTIAATSRESDNSTATQTGTVHVAVEAVADMPTVFGSNTSGLINTVVPVTIGGAVTDTDGSENVTFVIHGVPDGFALNHGINNGDNSWTLTPVQLAGLALIAPLDFEGRVSMTVQAVAHESEGDTELSAPASFNVGFGNASSGVQINLNIGIGIAGIGIGVGVGIGINLGDLTSTNGIVAMEDSTVHISDGAGLITAIVGLLSYLEFTGVPTGATFNHGMNMGGGVWRMSASDLTGLDLHLPANSSQDFTLGFQARLLTAITLPLSSTVVHVVGVADAPTLSVPTATGNEDSNGIALNISAGLTDSDEVLSLTIKGLPAGFHLSAGIDNGDGSWSLTPGQLAGLTVTPTHNFAGDVTYTVVATSTEVEGDSSATTATGTLHVNAVADAPVIDHIAFHGTEDQPVAMDMGIAVADADGSEHISSVMISGVPVGATLTHAADMGGGIWSADVTQLGSVQYHAPANWNGDVSLSVTATSTETSNGTHTNTSSTVTIHVDARADTPMVNATNESGQNDGAIALHITAGLADTDGSEHLSVILSGVPDGSVLSAGLNNGDGTWTLKASDLSSLSIAPPHDFTGDMHLSATSVATETSNGDMASSNAVNFTVHVDAAPAAFAMFFMAFSAAANGAGINDNAGAAANSDGDAFTHDAAANAHDTIPPHAFQDAQHQAG